MQAEHGGLIKRKKERKNKERRFIGKT